MKLTLALLLSMAVTPSLAGECSQAQLASLTSTKKSAFDKACSKTLGNSGTTAAELDVATLAALNACGDATCMAFFKELASDAPDCEVMGINLRSSLDLVVSLCKDSTGEDAPSSLPLPTWPLESGADTTNKPPSNLFPGIIPTANPQIGSNAATAKTTSLMITVAAVTWLAEMYQ